MAEKLDNRDTIGDVASSIIERREFSVLVGFGILAMAWAVTRPDIFFNLDSSLQIFSRLFRSNAPIFIMGVGTTFLIIGGEFDLSIGSTYAVGGIGLAVLVDSGVPLVASFLIVLAAGAMIGLTNGIVVTKIGVPSLIATIGMMSILRGTALFLIPGGQQSLEVDHLLIDILGGSFELAGITITHQILIALLVMFLGGIVLQKTKYGRHVYAVGDDPEAARANGIHVERIKIINFVLSGVTAVFAGMISITFFGAMFGTSGQGFALLVIAAVIIGGTNLFGGVGTMLGSFLGILVIGMIPIVLVLNGYNVEISEALTGVIIIGAVAVDRLLHN